MHVALMFTLALYAFTFVLLNDAYLFLFKVFNRQTFAMYRLANPLFPPGELLKVDFLFDSLSNGDLNTTLRLT